MISLYFQLVLGTPLIDFCTLGEESHKIGLQEFCISRSQMGYQHSPIMTHQNLIVAAFKVRLI